MITTRDINVTSDEEKKKFKRITTRDIDASIKVKPLGKDAKKPISLSTTNLPDAADILEKKMRDDIMAQRKAFLDTKTDGSGFKKLNRQFVFIDILETEEGFANEDEIQAFPRKELK